MSNKDAAYREQKIAALLKQTVPIPLTHYIGKLDGYHFAITEFMPGITLRDLLLSDFSYDLSAIMYEVGTILSRIATHEFSNVIPLSSSDDYLIFAKGCLKHETVLSMLTPETISKINQILIIIQIDIPIFVN